MTRSSCSALALACTALVVFAGCAIGAGRIEPSAGGRKSESTEVTCDEKTGDKTFVMSDGHAALADECVGHERTYDEDTDRVSFGVALGMKLGWSHVGVNGASASAAARDYFFEAVYRNSGNFGLAVEGGYTHVATDDIAQDSTFSGWYVMGRAMIPFGPLTLYATGGKAWTTFSTSLGGDVDAPVYRVGGGLMFRLPLFVDVVPRIEALAMPSAGGDVSASGSTVQGTLAFVF